MKVRKFSDEPNLILSFQRYSSSKLLYKTVIYVSIIKGPFQYL